MEAKYLQITESVKRQIRNGDYLIDRVPSERKLADSFGVSYMTARRAVQQLLKDDVFTRAENGRLALHPRLAGSCRHNVAVILPNWPIPSLDKWRKALQEVVGERGGVLKTVYYDHADDPVIGEALSGDFTRCFLALAVIPELMLQRLAPLRDRVVLFHHDLSANGFVSLDASAAGNIALLVNHLYALGHRRIGLVNTQASNEIITARIDAYRRRIGELGLDLQLFDAPVKPFERADLAAYELVRKAIGAEEFRGTGLIAATIEAAIGTLRAVHDCGLHPGREISVAAYGGFETARLSIPSITVTYTPDVEMKCRRLVEELLDRRSPERFLYSWMDMEVWLGESTGPAPETTR